MDRLSNMMSSYSYGKNKFLK